MYHKDFVKIKHKERERVLTGYNTQPPLTFDFCKLSYHIGVLCSQYDFLSEFLEDNFRGEELTQLKRLAVRQVESVPDRKSLSLSLFLSLSLSLSLSLRVL